MRKNNILCTKKSFWRIKLSYALAARHYESGLMHCGNISPGTVTVAWLNLEKKVFDLLQNKQWKLNEIPLKKSCWYNIALQIPSTAHFSNNKHFHKDLIHFFKVEICLIISHLTKSINQLLLFSWHLQGNWNLRDYIYQSWFEFRDNFLKLFCRCSKNQIT